LKTVQKVTIFDDPHKFEFSENQKHGNARKNTTFLITVKTVQKVTFGTAINITVKNISYFLNI